MLLTEAFACWLSMKKHLQNIRPSSKHRVFLKYSFWGTFYLQIGKGDRWKMQCITIYNIKLLKISQYRVSIVSWDLGWFQSNCASMVLPNDTLWTIMSRSHSFHILWHKHSPRYELVRNWKWLRHPSSSILDWFDSKIPWQQGNLIFRRAQPRFHE